MSRLRVGLRRGPHPSRAVRGLLTVTLAFVAAAPAVAGTSPIHGDDILVNNETAGTQVNPRVVMAPGSPGDSAGEGGAGTSPTQTIGTMWSDWDDGASLLQYRELESDGAPLDLQQSSSITPQWENMVGDLMGLGRDPGGALSFAFGAEIAGADASDPALLLPASGLEYAVIPPSANTGFQADMALRYAAEVGRLGEVHSSSHDVAGNPDPSIVLSTWDVVFGSPAVLQHGTTGDLNEGSSSSVGFSNLEYFHLSFEGPRQQGFLVVWESYGSAGNDTNLSSIQARFVSLDGVPLGSQFQVNTVPGVSQDDPPSIVARGREFVVVWIANGDVFLNGSFLATFGDGFESGDTAAWSAAVP